MKSFAIFLSVFIKLLIWVSSAHVNNSARQASWKTYFPEECGVAKVSGRIVGGMEAALGQFPWMARLGYIEKHKTLNFKCGGSLINSNYVLTASHCVQGKEDELKFVRLGENYADTDDDCDNGICAPPVQDIKIEKLISHPKFNYADAKNDVALIRLRTSVQYNDFVKPICLPEVDMLEKDYISQTVEVAGWGLVDSASQQLSDDLLFVRIPVRDPKVCNKVYSKRYHITPDNSQFCAGGITGEDACSGDSGGPMMKREAVQGIKKYFVLGVVSFGKSFCGEVPSVYANVMYYLDWILDTVQAGEEQAETVFYKML